MHILVIYTTTEGQTRKIASYIADVLRHANHNIVMANVSKTGQSLNLAHFDAYIVGGSIHLGRHQPALIQFVKKHRSDLSQKPAAFFSISLTAKDLPDVAAQEEIATYINEFIEETGWQPDYIGTFAGAVKYQDYGLLKRWLMHRISESMGASTDTTRNYEYTDWIAVEDFAKELLNHIEARGSVTP